MTPIFAIVTGEFEAAAATFAAVAVALFFHARRTAALRNAANPFESDTGRPDLLPLRSLRGRGEGRGEVRVTCRAPRTGGRTGRALAGRAAFFDGENPSQKCGSLLAWHH